MTAEPLLLVLNKHEDTMSYVDPATLAVVGTAPAGHDPHELVIRPDRQLAFISNYAPPGNTVAVVDLVERRLVTLILTEPYTRIHGAAMEPGGRFGYFTAGQTGYLVEVDLAECRVSRAIETHGEVSHMVVVSPEGEHLVTANLGTQNLSVIDRASGVLVTQIPCGRGGEGMTFTPDGREMWVANQDEGTITVVEWPGFVVNPARGVGDNPSRSWRSSLQTRTIPCPGMPLRIRFAADGRLALVSDWRERGHLVVLETATGQEIKRIPLGNQPIGVELSPDGERCFVTNMTSDEIHVVDMGTLEVSAVFRTGRGCDAMAWWSRL